MSPLLYFFGILFFNIRTNELLIHQLLFLQKLCKNFQFYNSKVNFLQNFDIFQHKVILSHNFAKFLKSLDFVKISNFTAKLASTKSQVFLDYKEKKL